jgi:hypothetical protein
MDTVGGIPCDERKGPKFVQFTREGEDASGILLAINKVKIGGKAAVRYVLEEGDAIDGKFGSTGDQLAFLGTADLIDKIRMTDFGHFVHVRFEGLDPNIEKNGNKMKRFKVHVSRDALKQVQPAAVNQALEITDEDIPF